VCRADQHPPPGARSTVDSLFHFLVGALLTGIAVLPLVALAGAL
jgi:hypothetical protein